MPPAILAALNAPHPHLRPTLLQKLLCRMGKCQRCLTASDERSVWAVCIDCGRTHAHTDRAVIRASIDRVWKGTTNTQK